ncbi:sugar transferase [Coraliomargarita sp. SDUM461004]|uniref:Sugar transferase n=1 Tax=Thalassobacterium sedimentorum TaxID=3041258 RepID=A0ABU1AMC6_9BACT|nr:sugar transferase [Coraliomargarita sp. SDUM461004]MDQ8195946.1 sugar transferase [Coraliomargarita sp. SDUM461004]
MEATTISSEFTLPRVRRESALRSTLMLLFGGDLLIALCATLLGFYLRAELPLFFTSPPLSAPTIESYAVYIISGTLLMVGILYLNGTYRLEALTRYRYGTLKMLACALYWSIVLLTLSAIFKINPPISRLWVCYSTGILMMALTTWRYFFCHHFIGPGLLQNLRRTTLIIGWNDRARQLYERSKNGQSSHSFFPFHICSAITMESLESQDDSHTPPQEIYLGSGVKTLGKLLQSGRYDTVILANSSLSMEESSAIQEMCGVVMVDFMMIPDFVRTMTACLNVESFQGTPLLTQTKRALDRPSSSIIKRTIDIAGGLFGLVVFSPVIAYFAWRVYRESPGPVFYKQVRLGKNERLFKIIKIRSMRLDAEKDSGAKWCTEDDPRRLEIGAFMRKYNIDELPQFWNVLKGEMSLVGPRPERPELIKDFKHQISYYNLRHTVKPGITGWAQVNGWRGDTSLEARIACDIEYIERWNPWLDLYICLRTVNANKNAY